VETEPLFPIAVKVSKIVKEIQDTRDKIKAANTELNQANRIIRDEMKKRGVDNETQLSFVESGEELLQNYDSARKAYKKKKTPENRKKLEKVERNVAELADKYGFTYEDELEQVVGGKTLIKNKTDIERKLRKLKNELRNLVARKRAEEPEPVSPPKKHKTKVIKRGGQGKIVPVGEEIPRRPYEEWKWEQEAIVEKRKKKRVSEEEELEAAMARVGEVDEQIDRIEAQLKAKGTFIEDPDEPACDGPSGRHTTCPDDRVCFADRHKCMTESAIGKRVSVDNPVREITLSDGRTILGTEDALRRLKLKLGEIGEIVRRKRHIDLPSPEKKARPIPKPPKRVHPVRPVTPVEELELEELDVAESASRAIEQMMKPDSPEREYSSVSAGVPPTAKTEIRRHAYKCMGLM
jgi:hypothetical protein